MSVNPIVDKYAPQRSSALRIPTSDRSYYVAGGHRDIDPWVVANDFSSRYYSGLDVSVYFGDTFVDEIIQIQYQEMEQTRPMFGYSDYTFRQVIHGSRMVQGSFAINFKDAGYIPILLSMIKNGADEDAAKTVAKLQARYANNGPDEDERKSLQYLNDQQNWSGDRIALSRDVTLEDVINTKTIAGAYDTDAYTDLMDNLKRKSWGDDATGATAGIADVATSFGHINGPKYLVTASDDELGFDIVIKYGQPEDYQGGRPGWGTLERIKDCHITGFSKAIDDTGRNVIESYTFLARTLD